MHLRTREDKAAVPSPSQRQYSFFVTPADDTSSNASDYDKKQVIREQKTPMASVFTNEVNHLHAQIKQKPEACDALIYSKYGVKKYLLKDLRNTSVEAWIYDQQSKPFPIVEDQINKVFQSVLAAVNKYGYLNKKDLDECKVSFDKRLLTLFSEKDIKTTLKVADEIIQKSVDELCNKIVKPEHLLLESLKAELWRTVDEVDEDQLPLFRKSSVLVINQNPLVNSVQYYQRGTMFPDAAHRHYVTAHTRDQAGIPNYVAYGNGHIHNGQCVITDVGFRHASLPPQDLYEDDTYKDKWQDKIVHETVAITLENIGLLRDEMKELSQQDKSKPLSWINVSLLTPSQGLADTFTDKQGRLYRETIIAAEAMRVMDAHFKPIMFCFGVNDAAIHGGDSPRFYSQDQAFENTRAFFQLHNLFFESLTASFNKSANTDFANFLSGINRAFKCVLKPYDEVETEINALATQYYHELMKQNYFSHKAADIALDDLLMTKMAYHKRMETLLQEYMDAFGMIKEEFKLLKLPESPEKYALDDFLKIYEMFTHKSWMNIDENFQLQARIIDLGHCLEKINSGNTQTSFNCKSNNDRSGLMAAFVDQIRLSRHSMHYDTASHFIGSAFTQHPILDTAGGGGKYLGVNKIPFLGKKLGIKTTSGVIDSDFQRLLKKTSEWASHKQYENYKRYDLLDLMTVIHTLRR